MPKIPNKNSLLVKSNPKGFVSKFEELNNHVEIWDHPGQPSITMGRIFLNGLPRIDIYMQKCNEVLVVKSLKKLGFTFEVRK